MRHHTLLDIILFLVAVFAAFSSSAAASPQAERQPGKRSLPLIVRLGYTSEGTYRDIALKRDVLTYTYNVRNSLHKPDQILWRQGPNWAQGDLVTEHITLPLAEVADMAKLIRQSGFMRLKPVYGDRKGRAYGTLLQAGIGRRDHQVLYLSGQYGGPPPKAFSGVESQLIQIVNRNCKHKIP